jgi:hypothetical protein
VLVGRQETKTSGFVFANREGQPYMGTSINHLHRDAFAPKVKGKRQPLFAGDFVLHSPRHTMLARLGELEWMLSPSCELPVTAAVERAFERLQLSGDFAVSEPKRLPPATFEGKASVTY